MTAGPGYQHLRDRRPDHGRISGPFGCDEGGEAGAGQRTMIAALTLENSWHRLPHLMTDLASAIAAGHGIAPAGLAHAFDVPVRKVRMAWQNP